MKLGTRNAGIRLDRAKWGMPARLTIYGDRDPCAGPGNIPWRIYWAHDLRWPVKLGLCWFIHNDQSMRWTGRPMELTAILIEYGWGWRKQRRTLWLQPALRGPQP